MFPLLGGDTALVGAVHLIFKRATPLWWTRTGGSFFLFGLGLACFVFAVAYCGGSWRLLDMDLVVELCCFPCLISLLSLINLVKSP